MILDVQAADPESCGRQALNTGSLAWSTCTGVAYWYMVASWGGYSFVINIIPIHVLVCIFTGRLSSRLYIAFAPFIVMGTLEAGEPLPQQHSRSLHSTAVRWLYVCSGPSASFWVSLCG